MDKKVAEIFLTKAIADCVREMPRTEFLALVKFLELGDLKENQILWKMGSE